MLYLAVGLICLALAHAVVPYLYVRLLRRRAMRFCRRERLIALSFDDGPGPVLTPLILDRLREATVEATFLPLGRNIAGNEELVRRILAEGHELGNHGQDHVHHLKDLPTFGILDTRRAWQTLAAFVGGPRRAPFRPPFGRFSLFSLLYVGMARAPIACWTHDSYDSRPAENVSPAQVVDGLRAAGGGILLLHDFDREDPTAEPDVLARLDAVLAMRHEGFRFRPLGEVLRNSLQVMGLVALL